MSLGRKDFHPRMVPEIRNGYFWLVKDQTGFGTTSFRIPEGNKHSAVDLVQATVASQHTLLTENGGLQARMRNRADPSPSLIVTGNALQAGWTGATYIAGLFRLPDNNGIIATQSYLFRHYSGAGVRRWNSSMLPAPISNLVLQASTDGTSNGLNRFNNANIFSGSLWVWVEHFFDPLSKLGGSSPAQNLKLATNLTLRTETSTTGTIPSSIFDGNSVLAICGSGIALAENTETTDWATFYYGNGIPTLKNRKRLANYLNPSNVKFQI